MRSVASAEVGCGAGQLEEDDELVLGPVDGFDPERGRQVEGELRWTEARVGVVVTMGGVLEDGGDGLGVFDHGHEAHTPLAPGANQWVVVKGVA